MFDAPHVLRQVRGMPPPDLPDPTRHSRRPQKQYRPRTSKQAPHRPSPHITSSSPPSHKPPTSRLARLAPTRAVFHTHHVLTSPPRPRSSRHHPDVVLTVPHRTPMRSTPTPTPNPADPPNPSPANLGRPTPTPQQPRKTANRSPSNNHIGVFRSRILTFHPLRHGKSLDRRTETSMLTPTSQPPPPKPTMNPPGESWALLFFPSCPPR